VNRQALVALLLAGVPMLGACRGEARPSSENEALRRTIDSMVPLVEQATGLPFKRRPRAAMITREQARAYISQNLERELAGGRGDRLTSSLHLFGLFPDSLDLGTVFRAVLGEQVAGYYDPDSSAFFGVEGATPQVLRLTVGHELVHALQHDYVPLDSIVLDLSNSDRAVAAHSVLEGQATIAMFRMLPEIGEQVLEQAFWDQVRESSVAERRKMPELAGAPRIIQEVVVFPYFGGAEYMRWWIMGHPRDEMPFGDRMPRSTEEIIAPERAARGDRPWVVTFVGADSAIYSDLLGAMEMRVLLAEARGSAELDDAAVLGWGGDRFQLYATPGGDALVWIAIFDTQAARDRALGALTNWPHPRAGYRRASEVLDVSGRPGLRLTVAPEGWTHWSSLPTAVASMQSP